MMNKDFIGYAIMVTVALIWGVGYTAIKICLEVLDPFTLGSLRFLFSAIFFLPLTFILWNKPTRKDLILIIILGLSGVSFYQIFYNLGANGISAGLSSILISTEPIFIYFISVGIKKDKISFSKILGIIISFVGIIFLFWYGINNSLEFISIILILMASISWSIYTVISKKVLEKYDALFVTSLSSLFGTLFLMPFLVNAPGEIIKMNSLQIFSFSFLVIFATFLAFYLNFKGVQILSATRASVFYYLSPVFTIISAYFLINELITINMIIGGILIIGGVAIVNK